MVWEAGRLEIRYDDLSKKWRVFQPVTVKSILSSKGFKTCCIDIGVKNLGTVWVEGWGKSLAFHSGTLLREWWYWTKKIAKHQSSLTRVNGKISETLKKPYRKRQRHFKHAVDAFARQLVGDLCELGVSKIVVGKLKHIRENSHNSKKANSMIHNLLTAEEYGIKVREISEASMSGRCPRCGSRKAERKGRFFRCLNCGFEAHRDAVEVLNMANLHGEGTAIGAVAHPSLLRWNGMK